MQNNIFLRVRRGIGLLASYFIKLLLGVVMSNLLHPDDSKRVADEIISSIKYLTEKAAEKIDDADFDISAGTRHAFNDLLQPRTSTNWKEDWLPWSVEEFLDKLRDGIASAIAASVSDRRRR